MDDDTALTTTARTPTVVTRKKRYTLMIDLEFATENRNIDHYTWTREIGEQICKSVKQTWKSKDKVMAVTAWVQDPATSEPHFVYEIAPSSRQRDRQEGR